MARSAASRPASSGFAAAAAGCAGLVTSTGGCGVPSAIAAVTSAIPSGLGSTLPCPIAAAACSTSPLGDGTEPLNESSGSFHFAPRPSAAAAVGSASSDSLRDAPMNAVLHECAKSSAKLGDPFDSPSKLANTLPSTVTLAGQGTICAGVTPEPSSA